MGRKCSIVLCGVGGYGSLYADALIGRDDVEIAGYVDPHPEGYAGLAALERRAQRFESLEFFYAAGRKADLCVISSPIAFHLPQAETAMRGGSHVLCEKPAAATPQEVRKMEQLRRETGRHLDIGFQWSHDEAILKLKEMVAAGKLGRAKRLRTKVLWPRDAAYYARAKWPGQVYDTQGNFILDSVASNATAHYLHNMLYVLGGKAGTSACPVSLQAELYKVYPIQTFDTVMCRLDMADGAQLLYYASHAVHDAVQLPRFCYEFEKGTAVYPLSDENPVIEVRYNDGTKEVLGDPFANDLRKLDWMIGLASGESSQPPPVPPLAALPLTLSVCGMHRSQPQAPGFPPEVVRTQGGQTYVEGLQEAINDCYDNGTLPSEAGVAWAKAGRRVAVSMEDVFTDPGIR